MSDRPHIVVTIARQLGAGGAHLGQRLAARLRCAYVDREILRVSARQVGATEEELAQWDERVSRFWDRLIDAFAVGPPDAAFASVPGVPAVRDDRLFELEGRVIRQLVERRSAVVIGRGAFWVLRDHPGLVRLFLHAPPAWRVPVVMKAYSLATAAEAEAMIDRVDRDRERFIQTLTGRPMADARNYDLAVCMPTVGFDAAEEMAVKLVGVVEARLGQP